MSHPRQPSLRDKLIVRLTSVRNRIQTPTEKIENPKTPAVLAEQYLIEMNQLEYEETFLLDALNKPARTESPLSERYTKP